MTDLLRRQRTDWLSEIGQLFPLVSSVPSGAYHAFSDFLEAVDVELRSSFLSRLMDRRLPELVPEVYRDDRIDATVDRYDRFLQDSVTRWKYMPISLQAMAAKRLLSPGFDPRLLGLSEEKIKMRLAEEGLSRTNLTEMEQRKAASVADIRRVVCAALRRIYSQVNATLRDEAFGCSNVGDTTVATQVYFSGTMPLTFSTSLTFAGETLPIFSCFEDAINNGHNHWDQIEADSLDGCLCAFDMAHARLFAMAELVQRKAR
jgi:hypothetical protein